MDIHSIAIHGLSASCPMVRSDKMLLHFYEKKEGEVTLCWYQRPPEVTLPSVSTLGGTRPPS